ncbi:MAG: SigB/SigF/SigG family RNA polymerase sigma factor [Streptosporangiaceae bacterium]
MAQQLLVSRTAISTSISTGISTDEGLAEAMLAEIAALPEDSLRRERLRAELVTMFSGYARSVARRYAGRGEPIEDIEQAAMLGLVKAINRFDPEVGDRFLAYAAPVVTGEVKRHFRDRTWTVRVPRRFQELHLAMREVNREFTVKHRRSATVAELAAIMEISEEECIEVIGANDAYRPASLDTPISDGENPATLGDLLGVDDNALAGVVDRESLQPLLGKLPERDRHILLLRFWGNQTQSEIAGQLGISQMHVSRLISRSLAYLRTELLK